MENLNEDMQLQIENWKTMVGLYNDMVAAAPPVDPRQKAYEEIYDILRRTKVDSKKMGEAMMAVAQALRAAPRQAGELERVGG
jgi:hypothetical protein